MPTIAADMSEYVSRIHFKTAAEIQAEVKGHPIMEEKYRIMLIILKEYGFEHWIHE